MDRLAQFLMRHNPSHQAGRDKPSAGTFPYHIFRAPVPIKHSNSQLPTVREKLIYQEICFICELLKATEGWHIHISIV